MHKASHYKERRGAQRFVATLHGCTWFWIVIGGERLPLNDLSLDGFSILGEDKQLPVRFSFELHLEGIHERISGQAEPVNFVAEGDDEGVVGCRFTSLEGNGLERLHEWLTVHVIRSASVRISAKEAEEIVKGRSLI